MLPAGALIDHWDRKRVMILCDTGRALALGSIPVALVLGRLGRKALASDEDVAVEAAMTAGPSTVRPSITPAAIVERMQEQKLIGALVTRSDGMLVGLLRRADAENALEAKSTDDWQASKAGERR